MFEEGFNKIEEYREQIKKLEERIAEFRASAKPHHRLAFSTRNHNKQDDPGPFTMQ